MGTALLAEIEQYWTGRSRGYSEVNITELNGCQRYNWSRYLREKISERFPGRKPDTIRVLDIGCGPGFISIILTEAGYHVTAADYTQAMLDCAQENAGQLKDSIRFERADAQALPFDDASFDVVFSRNLTWNLQDPEKAYSEWLRVLVPGGMMMVFDANWYRYLYDQDKREAYDRDRDAVLETGITDYNIGDNFDVMESIAMKMPLSPVMRPGWDTNVLLRLGADHVTAEENVGDLLYSEEEKLNFRSTPMFCVRAMKEQIQWVR